jgi:predicted nuclease of predicted toxin-antitoxin system
VKFLADENFARPAVNALRRAGQDVSWIAEDAAGSSDELVLARCAAERRTLLPMDKDFGELVFRKGLPSECGVILFRVKASSPTELIATVLEAVQSQNDWENASRS